MSLRRLFAVAPIGVVAAVMSGVVNGAFSSISVYADKAGFSDSRTGWFSAMSALGPILIVFPVGALSDRFRRTRVLTVAAAMASGLFLLAWMLPVGGFVTGLTVMAAGGLTVALYTMASSETNDHLTSSQIAAASELVVLMYGIGAIIGPFAVTGGMAAGGAAAYFWVMAVAHGFTVVLVASLWRARQRSTHEEAWSWGFRRLGGVR
jgi:MFS family permease